MHSADYAVARCLSVCPSVTRQYSIETATHIIKLFSLSVSHTHHSSFSIPNQTLWQCSPGDLPNRGVECTGVWQNGDFRLISYFISETMQDMAIATMKCEYETVAKLSNGSTFNDIEWPVTEISRSSQWRRISQKRYGIQIYYTAILIRTYTRPTQGCHLNSNDLQWPWNIQWHEVSRGLSAIAELLVGKASEKQRPVCLLWSRLEVVVARHFGLFGFRSYYILCLKKRTPTNMT